jgi:hypothetical protein
VGDAQQHRGVVGQEALVRHAREILYFISRNLLLVSGCERSVKITLWAGDPPRPAPIVCRCHGGGVRLP